MENTTLVLWDWNGTLLDDLDLSLHCLNQLLQEFSYQERYTLSEYRDIFGFPIEEYYLRAGFDFARTPFPELAVRFMELYLPASAHCTAMPHARETLQTITNMGIKQVVLSASPLDTLQTQTKQQHLTGFFDELLGLQDIYAKSKVELGTKWMAQSGIDPAHAVMIGDSVHDAHVAAAMGTRCILYAGGHQSEALLAQTGCPVIRSLSELPALL